MRVGLALDVPALDELFLFRALQERDVTTQLLYPYAGVASLQDFGGADVVLNRLQHRYRRLRVAQYIAEAGTRSFNPFPVEHFCHSKITMKRAFERAGVPTAPWLLVDFPLRVSTEGRMAWNRELAGGIADILEKTIGFPVVAKTTEGSRGSSILVLQNPRDFLTVLAAHARRPPTEVPLSMYPGIGNPEGFFLERYLPHPFDLRCIVAGRPGSMEIIGGLARVGSSEAELSKSSVYGFLPVTLTFPERIHKLAMRAVEAMVACTRALCGTWDGPFLVGLDVLACGWRAGAERKVYALAAEAVVERQVLEESMRRVDAELERTLSGGSANLPTFLADKGLWESVGRMDNALEAYRESVAHLNLSKEISDFLEHAQLYVAEVNARVDFGRITRALCIPDLQDRIVELALQPS